MSLESKLAIQEVIAQYSYTYDAKDAEAFSKLFTEDAVWELYMFGSTEPQVRLNSRQAIRDWAAHNYRGRTASVNSRHHQSGTLFDELTDGNARTRTMVLITHQNATDITPRPTLSGVYYDLWRKTAGGWKLARRMLYHDQSTPYNAS